MSLGWNPDFIHLGLNRKLFYCIQGFDKDFRVRHVKGRLRNRAKSFSPKKLSSFFKSSLALKSREFSSRKKTRGSDDVTFIATEKLESAA